MPLSDRGLARLPARRASASNPDGWPVGQARKAELGEGCPEGEEGKHGVEAEAEAEAEAAVAAEAEAEAAEAEAAEAEAEAEAEARVKASMWSVDLVRAGVFGMCCCWVRRRGFGVGDRDRVCRPWPLARHLRSRMTLRGTGRRSRRPRLACQPSNQPASEPATRPAERAGKTERSDLAGRQRQRLEDTRRNHQCCLLPLCHLHKHLKDLRKQEVVSPKRPLSAKGLDRFAPLLLSLAPVVSCCLWPVLGSHGLPLPKLNKHVLRAS